MGETPTSLIDVAKGLFPQYKDIQRPPADLSAEAAAAFVSKHSSELLSALNTLDSETENFERERQGQPIRALTGTNMADFIFKPWLENPIILKLVRELAEDTESENKQQESRGRELALNQYVEAQLDEGLDLALKRAANDDLLKAKIIEKLRTALAQLEK